MLPRQIDLSLTVCVVLKEPRHYLRRISMSSGYLRKIEKSRAQSIVVRKSQRLIKQGLGLLKSLGNYLRKDVSRRDSVLLVCPSPGKRKLRCVHHR